MNIVVRLLLSLCLLFSLGSSAQTSSINGVPNQAVTNPLGNPQIVMYSTACPVTVNTGTPISVFCPVGTDSASVTSRTYPTGYLVVKKAFRLEGFGIFSVPAANTNTAAISITVGGTSVMSLTTPAAPVGTNQEIDFTAICTVVATNSLRCTGVFNFVVANATGAPVGFDQTSSFTYNQANLIDVLGSWNGTVTSQTTTVTQAVLTALN